MLRHESRHVSDRKEKPEDCPNMKQGSSENYSRSNFFYRSEFKGLLYLLSTQLLSHQLRSFYLNLLKFTWIYLIYLNLPKFTTIYLNFPENTWIYVNLLKFTWIYMNIHEFIKIYLNLPEITGIYRILPEFTG